MQYRICYRKASKPNKLKEYLKQTCTTITKITKCIGGKFINIFNGCKYIVVKCCNGISNNLQYVETRQKLLAFLTYIEIGIMLYGVWYCLTTKIVNYNWILLFTLLGGCMYVLNHICDKLNCGHVCPHCHENWAYTYDEIPGNVTKQHYDTPYASFDMTTTTELTGYKCKYCGYSNMEENIVSQVPENVVLTPLGEIKTLNHNLSELIQLKKQRAGKI